MPLYVQIRDTFWRQFSFCFYVSSRDWTQVVSLNSKYLYSPSPLTDPDFFYFSQSDIYVQVVMGFLLTFPMITHVEDICTFLLAINILMLFY